MVGHAQLQGEHGGQDRFDITADHRAQLSFGRGAHYCLGAQLARTELIEALPILAQRLPDLEVGGEADYRPDMSGVVGPDRLPLRFTATHTRPAATGCWAPSHVA
jgi:cytochrome P450